MSKTLLFLAGPNGSGKSTITRHIQSLHPDFPKLCLDPDQIEKTICLTSQLNFESFNLSVTSGEWESYIAVSPLLVKLADHQSVSPLSIQQGLRVEENNLHIYLITIDSYVAALVTDFIRFALIEKGISFMMETVMSHISKLDLLEYAKSAGYHTVLYFVTTQDPSININRVAIRVRQGGHDVNQQKIVDRYYRCMELLFDALKIVDEAYLYDNSSDGANPEEVLVAKKQQGKLIEGEYSVNWFEQYVVRKLS